MSDLELGRFIIGIIGLSSILLGGVVALIYKNMVERNRNE